MEQSQGAAKHPHDIEVKIRYSSEASQAADDNEIPEKVSTEENIGQITIVGGKTDPVPDIGWV